MNDLLFLNYFHWGLSTLLIRPSKTKDYRERHHQDNSRFVVWHSQWILSGTVVVYASSCPLQQYSLWVIESSIYIPAIMRKFWFIISSHSNFQHIYASQLSYDIMWGSLLLTRKHSVDKVCIHEFMRYFYWNTDLYCEGSFVFAGSFK